MFWLSFCSICSVPLLLPLFTDRPGLCERLTGRWPSYFLAGHYTFCKKIRCRSSFLGFVGPMLKTALYQSDRHKETKKTYNNQPRSVRRLNAGKKTKMRTGKRRGKVPQTNTQLKHNSNCKQKGDRWRILHTHMKKRGEECRANLLGKKTTIKSFIRVKARKKNGISFYDIQSISI